MREHYRRGESGGGAQRPRARTPTPAGQRGIPGFFPARDIDNYLYVDGAITGNILYGGRIGESETLPALWQARHPGVPMPRRAIG